MKTVQPFVQALLEAFTTEGCVWASDWPFVKATEAHRLRTTAQAVRKPRPRPGRPAQNSMGHAVPVVRLSGIATDRGRDIMTLLVTGAMGHVGYEIVRKAAQRGMQVIGVYRDNLPEAEAKAAGSGVKWLQCDLADAAAVRTLADAHRIDACIHAAAVSNEAYARPAPLLAVDSNVGATANLLEVARTKSWRRFLLVSTGAVVPAAGRYERSDPGGPADRASQRLQHHQGVRPNC
jgi:hypothetical protein